jgi:hypothetical protein
MADPGRGKAIFDKRVEYPLPKLAGVRDFLFYFVSAGDGYGRGARRFFDRFYKNHVRADVGSLEQLVATLNTAVTSGGVQRIREIVIVSHGNADGLLFRIVTAATDTTQKEYKYLTALSLALLQKDFRDGALAGFAAQRKTVLAHLDAGSWVTVRACNFGQSRPGIYALYAFFGGKPNVYVPTVYQFFGSAPIMDGMRFESRLKVHEHLVRQRFLPADVHTPDRQDAVVRALVDPAQFSQPFNLAALPAENPDPAESAVYEALVDDLNAGRLSAPLKAKFAGQSLTLSKGARLRVLTRNTAWRINDVLEHAGESFGVGYEVAEEFGVSETGNRETFTLRAAAQLAEVKSAKEFVPMQLFFEASENDVWRGKRFTLAFHTEESGADPADKAKFDAMLALLNAASFSDGTVDLRAAFRDEGIDLTPQASLSRVGSTGTGASERITWAIADTARFLVKLEHPATSNGIAAHTLTVYDGLDAKARLRNEYDLMAYLGTSPDCPGTELPAYLDTLSIEDLTDLMDHLRAPYRPGNCYTIHHAQQALKRKKAFLDWFLQRHPEAATVPLIEDDYVELPLHEREELRTVAYAFDFSRFWAEVKASSPSATAFQDDLFAEEDLAQVLRIPADVIASRAAPEDAESDSPYTDAAELRALERGGAEAFFATEKFTFEPPEADPGLSCAEFAAVIAKWQALQSESVEDIEAALGLLKTKDGKTYLQWAAQIWDMSFPVRMGLALNNMSLLKDGLLVKLVARIPGVVAVGAEGIVTSSIGLALLRIWPVIGIPLRLWKEFLMEQQKTEAAWEMIGKVTAMRQWVRQLEGMTFRTVFPDTISINVSTPTSVHPYFIGRYYDELVAEWGRYFSFIFAPERMKKGYDEGVRLMDAALPDILAKAEEAVAEALSEKDLDACKIKVLADAGLFDAKAAKALAIREITRVLLEKLPKV